MACELKGEKQSAVAFVLPRHHGMLTYDHSLLVVEMTEVSRMVESRAHRFCGLLMMLTLLVLMAPGAAQAKSPIPYFQGVERIGLHCSRLVQADPPIMPPLCDRLAEVIAERYAVQVSNGADGLSEPGSLYLLINSHEWSEVSGDANRTVSTNAGPITVFTIGLFRSGYTNPLLRDLPPYLHFGNLDNTDLDTLATALADRVATIVGLVASEN